MATKNKLTAYGRLVKTKLLEKDGMSQEKLAKKVGTSSVYLSRVFRGQRSGEKYIPLINKELGIDMKRVGIRKVI